MCDISFRGPDARAELLQARAVLAEHAAATEERGRPTPESRAAAGAAGAFAVTTPREFGGLGADHRSISHLLTELGAGCASTAWVAAISAMQKWLVSDYMTPEVRQAVYTHPNVQVCGNGQPLGRGDTIDGGYLIDGRWGYASGCQDAGWAILAVGEIDGKRSELPCMAMMPTALLRIEKTWGDAIGMRGTGSHTLVAQRVFVAADFVMHAPFPGNGPLPGTLMLAAVLHSVSPLVGATKGALDMVAEFMTAERPVAMSALMQRSQSPSARALFVETSELVATAELRLWRAADILDAAGANDPLSEKELAHARMQVVTALQECRRALDTLLDLRGSSALVWTDPVARAWRDVAMGSRHVGLMPSVTTDHLSGLMFGRDHARHDL
jgi:alkylation response protein AidB-like acyl-CoA dehydrogenase